MTFKVVIMASEEEEKVKTDDYGNEVNAGLPVAVVYLIVYQCR